MKQFLMNNWVMITILLLLVIVLVILWVRGKKNLVKRIIYMLVCQAEQAFGSKTGPIKFAMVWAELYNRLPILVRALFPEEELNGYIKEAVELLKKQLQSGDLNLLTYNEESKLAITGPVFTVNDTNLLTPTGEKSQNGSDKDTNTNQVWKE